VIKVHFIIHEYFEAPGAYEIWAKERGYIISYSRVYEGETLPDGADDFDLLIVMGGPQRPSTSLDECSHFDAKREILTIKKFLSLNKPVIGICLGSQLIGEAFEAKFEESPFKEIGSYPITFTKSGTDNELFSDFPETVEVGHWHGDMPGLTSESKIIAYSEGCPRQIVQYSEMVYGFQCHMELTREVAELLIEASQDELKQLAGEKFIQSPEELLANDYRHMNELLYTFLDKLVNTYEVSVGV
jgi:GMP synthase (glutamine-hydrolysing)